MFTQEINKKLKHAIDNFIEVALITVTKHIDNEYLGLKTILWPNGKFFTEDDGKDPFVQELAKQCLPFLKSQTTKAITFDWNGVFVECFIEVMTPPIHLIVAGAGHIAEPVVKIGAMLGFRVTVIDDRQQYAKEVAFPDADKVICQPFLDFFRSVPLTEKTYILLVTRGHQYDVTILRELLRRDERPAYIGMIGSKRRISGVFSQLKENFADDAFESIFSPVGLDIGAQTPSEIAVSIMAEILKVKNGGTGQSLRESLKCYTKTRFTERMSTS